MYPGNIPIPEVIFQSRRATREKNSIRFPTDGAAIYYFIIVLMVRARTYVNVPVCVLAGRRYIVNRMYRSRDRYSSLLRARISDHRPYPAFVHPDRKIKQGKGKSTHTSKLRVTANLLDLSRHGNAVRFRLRRDGTFYIIDPRESKHELSMN